METKIGEWESFHCDVKVNDGSTSGFVWVLSGSTEGMLLAYIRGAQEMARQQGWKLHLPNVVKKVHSSYDIGAPRV